MLRVEGEGIVSAHYREIVRKAGNDYRVFLLEPVSIANLADKSDRKAKSPSDTYNPGQNVFIGHLRKLGTKTHFAQGHQTAIFGKYLFGRRFEI